MWKQVLGVMLAAAILALPAAAQEQRASIQGVVKDAQGGVLPGVTVEARHSQGAVTPTVTDADGTFRFPSLLPGRYEVTAALESFRTAKVENLELLLGQIKTVDFTLEIAAVSEEVVVKAEAPLVDTRQSARATSIAREQIDFLPKGRDFTTLVTQASGANGEGKSNGLMIDGATSAESRYILDGAETSDLVNGGSGKRVLPDFIEEVQVKSSGYTAEYGGATGGVINVITKSGTNLFRGSALFYAEDSRLASSAPAGYSVGTPTLRLKLDNANEAEFVTYPKDQYRRLEPGFSLGGPLLQNRAWFYAAYQPTFERVERTVTWVGDGQTQESATRTMPSRFLTANQTSQIGSSIRTRVAYNNSWRKSDSVGAVRGLPAEDGSDVPGLNYDFGTTQPNFSLSGQLDWVARQTLFLSARVGYFKADRQTYGIPEDSPRFIWMTSTIGMAGVPASLQRTALAVNVPSNSAIDFDKQEHLSFQADATWYGKLGGEHAIKGGFQIDRLANSVNSYETGPRVQLYSATDGSQRYRNQTGAFGYYRFRVALPTGTSRGFSTTGDVATANVGLFVQDAWTISRRVTINLGLRTETERVDPFQPGLDLATGLPAEGSGGMEAIKFGLAEKLAPRIGMAWDVKGDGRWKTYASWGMFYDIFKMNLSRGSFGGEKWQEYWYTLETPDWTTLLDPVGQGNCPPACPASMGRYIRGPFDYRAPGAVDPDLKPMRAQELSAGVEHQLAGDLALSARYVRKWIDRAVEDTGAFSEAGEVYVIANPGFGMTQYACAEDLGCNPSVPLPKAKRTYDAIEFAFTKNLSRNYYARVSYLWSRLFGNFPGLDQTDENGRNAPNTGRLYDYPLQSFDGRGYAVEGVLPTDRPHQVKAQFIYQFPFGSTVGANLYVGSGIPKTREIAVISPSGYPMFYMGRGSDGRMPMYSQVDFTAQHEFKVGSRYRVQVMVNVLNLFNQRVATNYYATESASGKYLDFDEAAFYAHEVDVAALKATTPGWAADPRFLVEGWGNTSAPGYQMPRQTRFGVKFLF